MKSWNIKKNKKHPGHTTKGEFYNFVFVVEHEVRSNFSKKHRKYFW